MLNFTSLPKDKPSQNTVSNGRYKAIIFKTQMVQSKKDANQEYLNVSFKLDDGGFVNENYFDSDKPFVMYKLGRLLNACNVKLEGEGSLRDVAKVIQNKRVVIDVVINDRGYASLDYTGDNEGIYAPEDTSAKDNAELKEVFDQAIEADVMNDEDF